MMSSSLTGEMTRGSASMNALAEQRIAKDRWQAASIIIGLLKLSQRE